MLDERVPLTRPRARGSAASPRWRRAWVVLRQPEEEPLAQVIPIRHLAGDLALPAPATARGFSLYFTREQVMSIQSINARNQFRGKIKEIILGPVVSEVDVDTPGIVTSVITTRSVRN